METAEKTPKKPRKQNPEAEEAARIIKVVVTSLDIRLLDLAETLGMHKQQIYDYTMGKQLPQWKFWMNLKKHYPQVSAEFLLTGKGEVLLDR